MVKIRYVKRDTRVDAIKKLKIKCDFCKKVYATGWMFTRPICSKCRIKEKKPRGRVYG